MPTNPPKKRAPAKSTAKKASAKHTPAKKSAARKSAKAKSASREGKTLQRVARSIGATLGTLAKSTSDAVSAAKNALPNIPGIKKSE